jgi:hypothetical protein
MLSTIEQDIKKVVPNTEKIINLANISKRDEFDAKVEDFFKSSNPNTLLVVFADMLNDSKNRINMCRSIINNSRLNRAIQNKDSVLPIKHVCFILRID